MARDKFGISIDPDLRQSINDIRVSDDQHPDFQSQSEFIEELLVYGLTVRLTYESWVEAGLIDEMPHPYSVASTIQDALRARYEDESGERAPSASMPPIPSDIRERGNGSGTSDF